MNRREARREASRRILWADREEILPHLLEHQDCGVYSATISICEDAGWTFESYLLAALFDRDELLVEVSE